MARLFSSGFELNSIGANVEWTAAQGTPTISTTTVRSGTYALEITGFSSGVPERLRYQYTATVTQGPIYTRSYFRYATLPSAANSIITFYNSGGAPRIWIKIDNTGVLTLFDEDGQIGSASSALSANTWYMIDLMYDLTAATGSHIIRARLAPDDGTTPVEFASATNRAISDTTGLTSFVVGGNINSEAQTTGDWFFDDIAINDSTGSFQNTYPGSGKIIHLRPNAAGDNEAWNEGTTASPNTYQDVDEVTPDDTTTKITESTSTGELSDFNLDATPAAISSGDTINLVQAGVRFNGTAAGTQAFALRVKATSGGTVESSGNIVANSTTYMTNTNAAPRNYPLTLYDLPGASTTPWTKADLDTAQLGVDHTIDNGTNPVNVSTLWLLVDFTPSTTSVKDIIGMGFIPFAR